MYNSVGFTMNKSRDVPEMSFTPGNYIHVVFFAALREEVGIVFFKDL